MNRDRKTGSARSHGGLLLISLLLLVYLALHVLARTAGARSLLADQIEAVTGRKVTVESLRLGWDLSLIARGVSTSEGGQPGRPGLVIGSLLVRGSPAGFLRGRSWLSRVEIHSLRLHLCTEDGARWQPERLLPFAGSLAGHFHMSEFLQVSPRPLPDLPPEVRIQEGEVRWWDEHGREVAYVTGIQAVGSALRVPGRDMHYRRLQASRARDGRVGEAGDLLVEEIELADRRLVLEERRPWHPLLPPVAAPVREE